MKAVRLMLCALMLASHGLPAQAPRDEGWKSTFDVDVRELIPTGASRYFILDPGSHVVLENGDERLVITALDETHLVGDVTTRVVEERETREGKLVEVSRNFMARHPKTGDVFDFGEEVDIYRNGKVVSHEGAWLAGVRGKVRPVHPGCAGRRGRYHQEIAPKVAMDRVRIVSTTAKAVTPAGTFEECVRLEETTPLEPGVKDYKVFAPGIGIVQDGSLKLVRHGRR